MLDMWTDVFASPGKRTTGTKAGKWAVVPPGWGGELPSGLTRIDAPTPYVWVIGRTQTNGPADYDAVHKIQDGYTITPLAGNNPLAVEAPGPPIDAKADPLKIVTTMPAQTFFPYAIGLTKLHPPHITDEPIIARMARIGLVVGQSFDFAGADPMSKRQLEAAPAAALGRDGEKDAHARAGRRRLGHESHDDGRLRHVLSQAGDDRDGRPGRQLAGRRHLPISFGRQHRPAFDGPE